MAQPSFDYLRLITLAAFMLVTAPVLAEPQDAPATPEQKAELCQHIGTLAHTIMEKRQQEIPMSDLLAIKVNGPDTMTALVKQLIIAAYEMPAMSVEENQENMADKFRNIAELICFKSINK